MEQTLQGFLPFYDQLNTQEKSLLTNSTRGGTFEKGATFQKGEGGCSGVLLIRSGQLRAYMLSEDGREITLYRLYAGDVCTLSVSCILDEITFDVFLDTQEESEILVIPTNIVEELSKKNVYVENFLYKETTKRFSDVMWAMQQILFMSLDKRLAVFLVDEMANTGSNVIALTHEQIARYMGSAREVVTRMLKYFQQEGFVTLSRGKITIIDQKGLRNLTI